MVERPQSLENIQNYNQKNVKRPPVDYTEYSQRIQEIHNQEQRERVEDDDASFLNNPFKYWKKLLGIQDSSPTYVTSAVWSGDTEHIPAEKGVKKNERLYEKKRKIKKPYNLSKKIIFQENKKWNIQKPSSRLSFHVNAWTAFTPGMKGASAWHGEAIGAWVNVQLTDNVWAFADFDTMNVRGIKTKKIVQTKSKVGPVDIYSLTNADAETSMNFKNATVGLSWNLFDGVLGVKAWVWIGKNETSTQVNAVTDITWTMNGRQVIKSKRFDSKNLRADSLSPVAKVGVKLDVGKLAWKIHPNLALPDNMEAYIAAEAIGWNFKQPNESNTWRRQIAWAGSIIGWINFKF